MTEFLAALAFTYLCNSTAELRIVSYEEATGCTLAYEQVKQHFTPEFDIAPTGTRNRREQNIAAYLAFKQWEKDNPELVSDMQAEAARQARNAVLANG